MRTIRIATQNDITKIIQSCPEMTVFGYLYYVGFNGSLNTIEIIVKAFSPGSNTEYKYIKASICIDDIYVGLKAFNELIMARVDQEILLVSGIYNFVNRRKLGDYYYDLEIKFNKIYKVRGEYFNNYKHQHDSSMD